MVFSLSPPLFSIYKLSDKKILLFFLDHIHIRMYEEMNERT